MASPGRLVQETVASESTTCSGETEPASSPRTTTVTDSPGSRSKPRSTPAPGSWSARRSVCPENSKLAGESTPEASVTENTDRFVSAASKVSLSTTSYAVTPSPSAGAVTVIVYSTVSPASPEVEVPGPRSVSAVLLTATTGSRTVGRVLASGEAVVETVSPSAAKSSRVVRLRRSPASVAARSATTTSYSTTRISGVALLLAAFCTPPRSIVKDRA